MLLVTWANTILDILRYKMVLPDVFAAPYSSSSLFAPPNFADSMLCYAQSYLL